MNSTVVDLKKEMKFARNCITSHTLRSGKTMLFCFDAGQQLSEHTASVAASMHFLEGRARLKLGGRWSDVGPGTWVFMNPRLTHAIVAKTKLAMLLTLFDGVPSKSRKLATVQQE